MKYKIKKDVVDNYDLLIKINEEGRESFIPFDPANTDYQNFKKQINADEAQLEDAEGNLMTAEQAKEFVATLP